MRILKWGVLGDYPANTCTRVKEKKCWRVLSFRGAYFYGRICADQMMRLRRRSVATRRRVLALLPCLRRAAGLLLLAFGKVYFVSKGC